MNKENGTYNKHLQKYSRIVQDGNDDLVLQFTTEVLGLESLHWGYWDDNDQLLNLSWYDPDNYNLSSGNQDIVTFDVLENINWMGVNTTTGEVYCISAPTNNDAGSSTILLSLTDDRPISPQSIEYEHNMAVVANDAPGFTNLNSFPDGMNANDTLNFDLEWVDPNEDLTLFNLQVGSYYADQLSWFNIDQSGNVEIIPGSNHNGEYELKFYMTSSLSRQPICLAMLGSPFQELQKMKIKF